MPRRHRVEPGDWLGSLAHRFGLPEVSKIWDDPANEELRGSRGSPDFVMAGDDVVIPDGEETPIPRVATGRRHTFVLAPPTDMLRVRLSGLDAYLEVFEELPYELEAGRARNKGILRKGETEVSVPLYPDVRKATLQVLDRKLELQIGGLGPASEARGAYHRLVNLGFLADPGEQEDKDEVVDPLSEAVSGFRASEGLDARGGLTDDVRARLEQAYGA